MMHTTLGRRIRLGKWVLGGLLACFGASQMGGCQDGGVNNGEVTLSFTSLVSVGSTQEQANGSSSSPAVSRDGRFVAFVSTSTNLDPADTDTQADIYLRDTSTNATKLVSRASGANGVKGTFLGSATSYSASSPSISADGQYVAFLAKATNLFGPSTTLSSAISPGATSIAVAASPAGSWPAPGGRAFVENDEFEYTGFNGTTFSGVRGVDNSHLASVVVSLIGTSNQVYVRDTLLDTTELVSVDDTGNLGAAGDCSAPAISGDGRWVAFASTAYNLSGVVPQTTLAVQANAVLQTAVSAWVGPGWNLMTVDVDTVQGFQVNGVAFIDGDDFYINSIGTDLDTYDGYITSAHSPGASVTGVTSVTLADASNFPESGWAVVGADLFQYKGKSGNTLTDIYAYFTGADAVQNVYPAGVTSIVRPASSIFGGGTTQVFVRDLAPGGTTSLGSVNPAATSVGNGSSTNPSLSDDGQVLAFQSGANNLLPSYSRIIATKLNVAITDPGTTTQITVDDSAAIGGFPSGGSNVAYVESDDFFYSTITANGGSPPTYTFNGVSGVSTTHSQGAAVTLDAVPGSWSLTVLSTAGFPNPSWSYQVTAYLGSDDFTYWSISGNTFQGVSGISGVPSVAAAASLTQPGADQVYVRTSGGTNVVSIPTGTSVRPGNGASRSPSVSDDGRYVAFQSAATDLIPADNNGKIDIFRRDRTGNETILVSITSQGGQAASDCTAPSISADATRVVFVSNGQNLVDDKTTSVTDVFMRNVSAGTTQRISVATYGTEAKAGGAQGRISRDGNWAVFASSSNDLVPNDKNGQTDVFMRGPM